MSVMNRPSRCVATMFVMSTPRQTSSIRAIPLLVAAIATVTAVPVRFAPARAMVPTASDVSSVRRVTASMPRPAWGKSWGGTTMTTARKTPMGAAHVLKACHGNQWLRRGRQGRCLRQ